MTPTTGDGARAARHQVNLTLDEHEHLVLKQLTARDGLSIPEILKPIVVEFLREQESTDADLGAAVAALERSRRKRQPRTQVHELRARRRPS